jgi:predicted amidohydrolase YtcJ
VTTLSPLEGIEVAVTRRPLGELETEPLVASQAISLEQGLKNYACALALSELTNVALYYYTKGSAYANHLDDCGSIAVGYAADLLVLDKNLFEIEPHLIHTARVLTTMIDGVIVYTAE